MKFGAIDIGTGSVLCLAVEQAEDGQLQELINESVITSLGTGTLSEKRVGQEAQQRTLSAVVSYVGKLQAEGVEHISVVGTSALRRASNRREFVERVRQETGVEVEVISGEDEARLTFWGATSGLDWAGPVVVMDVGGGSSELVLGHCSKGQSDGLQEPALFFSVPIGSLVLTERFITGYPVSPGELRNLTAGIREEFRNETVQRIVQESRRFADRPLLVGVGGSATTLVAMEWAIHPYVASLVQGREVHAATASKHIERLAAMSLEERHEVVGLPKGRAPVIDAGLSILLCLLGEFGSDSMTVSDRGLRYGVVVRDICMANRMH